MGRWPTEIFYLGQLLVALLSSYRYEGPKVNEEIAKMEAQSIFNAVKTHKDDIVENDDLVRILSTRSKLHLKAVYKHYKEISGNYLDEVLHNTPSITLNFIRLVLNRFFSQVYSVYVLYVVLLTIFLLQDLGDNLRVKETVQCLCNPQTYFSEVRLAQFFTYRTANHVPTLKHSTKEIVSLVEYDIWIE